MSLQSTLASVSPITARLDTNVLRKIRSMLFFVRVGVKTSLEMSITKTASKDLRKIKTMPVFALMLVAGNSNRCQRSVHVAYRWQPKFSFSFQEPMGPAMIRFRENFNLMLKYLVEKGLAGIEDREGNSALYLLGAPTFLFSVSEWAATVLHLLQAGETLLAFNREKRTAAEVAFAFLQRQSATWFPDAQGPNELGCVDKVVIHLMEELRREESQEERPYFLHKEQRHRLHFLCSLFKRVASYDEKRAEESIKKNRRKGDKILLQYLEKQREWVLAFKRRAD